jgi:peptide/nickel transport system permease protein
MVQYIIRRLLQVIPILVLIAVGIFFLVHFLPGDPVEAILGSDATAADIAATQARYGLDRPVVEQFWTWISGFVQGDFGRSYATGRSVTTMITASLPVTATLAICAIVVCLAIGVPAALSAAFNQGRFWDRAVLGGSLVGISVPSFVLGIVLILIFSVLLGLFPSSGYRSLLEDPAEGIRYFALPALSLGLLYSANIARIGRAATLEVLSMDFVTTARASGLSPLSIRYKHVLKNALNPILTITGVTFGGLLGGTIVTEQVFNLPGVGTLILNSITRRDYPVIQAAVLLVAVIYLFINLLVDVLYALVDPKVRYGHR